MCSAAADIEAGIPFTAPIIFGSTSIPAEAYGLAFTLQFDLEIIREAEVEIADSWLGLVEQDLLTINKNFSSDGIIEIALTRTDKTNLVGAGPIAGFIGIIDDIEGYKGQTGISIERVQAIDKEGNLLKIYTPLEIINFAPESDTSDDIIKVFPNPSSDLISLENNIQSPIQSMDIHDISGQFVQSIPVDQSSIDIKNLPKGLYLIKVKIADRTYYKKFVKQ